MIQFSKIIREIDAELKPEWQPGAFKWADDHMGKLHASAIDRFERSLIACEARSDWESLRVEADLYKHAMLKCLKAFKEDRGMSDQESFLKSLGIA